MLDAAPAESSSVGYVLRFNTTKTLDRSSVEVWTQYGTSAKTALQTSMNKKYEAVLELDGAVGGTSGATVSPLSASDRVTVKSGTASVVAVVSRVETVNSVYTVSLRYDSSSFLFSSGTSKCLVYGDAGVSWNGSSATNAVSSVVSERTSPGYMVFYNSAIGSSVGYVEVDLVEGDVSVRRALTVASALIDSGTSGFTSVDVQNRRLYFTSTSAFPLCGGTTSYTLSVWNTSTYEWCDWEYTVNSSISNPPYLSSVNDVPDGVEEGMRVVMDSVNKLKRIEVSFKNKIDKLKLRNRALFYSSKDLIVPIDTE
jgi:hypothetical protein